MEPSVSVIEKFADRAPLEWIAIGIIGWACWKAFTWLFTQVRTWSNETRDANNAALDRLTGAVERGNDATRTTVEALRILTDRVDQLTRAMERRP